MTGTAAAAALVLAATDSKDSGGPGEWLTFAGTLLAQVVAGGALVLAARVSARKGSAAGVASVKADVSQTKDDVSSTKTTVGENTQLLELVLGHVETLARGHEALRGEVAAVRTEIHDLDGRVDHLAETQAACAECPRQEPTPTRSTHRTHRHPGLAGPGLAGATGQ